MGLLLTNTLNEAPHTHLLLKSGGGGKAFSHRSTRLRRHECLPLGTEQALAFLATFTTCLLYNKMGRWPLEKKTKGAWLLAQSKSLSGYTGGGATRLENVSHSGKIGRLYNLLRRQADDQTTFTISKQTIETTCKLNGIEKSDRLIGLQVLQDAGRIDVAKDGAVAVLGATTQAVLEATAEIFDDQNPTPDEQAIIDLSERVSGKPVKRAEAEEYISDTHKLAKADATSLVDLSKKTALIDEEGEQGHGILFNSHTFATASTPKRRIGFWNTSKQTSAFVLPRFRKSSLGTGRCTTQTSRGCLERNSITGW